MTYDGQERRHTPRRRVDDWRTASDVPLRRGWLEQMVLRLGYNPESVVAVHLTPTYVTVTHTMGGKNSDQWECVRHEVTD